MKKLLTILLCLCLMLNVINVVALAEGEVTSKPKVVILATGGTIAGVGEAGKTAGYEPGALTAEELISAVPELEDVAEIEAIQICNVNSDDITAEVWLELAKTINEMSADPEVAGFVITHGTDTLEETAYFLNLTVKTDKPVVLTGAMRPATALSPDGPLNLYEAVCVAASEEAVGQGVLIVFSDRIYSARSMTKVSTYSVMAISAGEAGDIGIVRDGGVYIYELPARKHTLASEFDVNCSGMPRNIRTVWSSPAPAQGNSAKRGSISSMNFRFRSLSLPGSTTG